MAFLTPLEEPEYKKQIAALQPNASFNIIKPVLLAIPEEDRTINILKAMINDHQTLKDATLLTIIAALYPDVRLHRPHPEVTARRFLDMKVTGQAHSVTAFFATIKEWQPQQKQPEPEKHPEQDRLWTKIMRALGRNT